MHRIHNEYEKHSNNYGDLVWWDMIFGTYHNPKEFTSDEKNELRLREMLTFKDVNKQKETKNSC
tara:strand:+ start:999 stop:1190 length:192 start_codon:yes stop_codon:yes gene_type:complete